MRYWIEKGQRYVQSMTLLEIALLKFCMLGLGIVIGASALEKRKSAVRACGAVMFLLSYVPLMSSFLAELFPEE